MSKRKTTKDFVKEAILLHRNKFNYYFVNYIDSKTPVKIQCNNCLLFLVLHLI